ncbi:hypothetical protein [Mesorhizobium sp. J8]|uniref:hypothetical protein n=1 Tax=Mesorhizobium sp. J8 TaxID=2777475 RepID=UPI001916664D|nr:hypothetical protein [Mesorhizobium sp. J8]
MIRDVGLFTAPGAEAIVREACSAEAIDPALLDRLIVIEQEFAGMLRRRGIFEAIDAAFSDWPDESQ